MSYQENIFLSFTKPLNFREKKEYPSDRMEGRSEILQNYEVKNGTDWIDRDEDLYNKLDEYIDMVVEKNKADNTYPGMFKPCF